MKNLNSQSIERYIDFSREDYEQKREQSSNEMVDFDDFINNVRNDTEEKFGTIEDAIRMANDHFLTL